MKTEIKKAWVEALRSGEFKQGQGNLKHIASDGSATYCCLGVLCEIAVRQGVEVDLSPGERPGLVYFDTEACYLPSKIRDWAGVYNRNPDVLLDGEQRPVAALNDEGRSFAEIADLIEEFL